MKDYVFKQSYADYQELLITDIEHDLMSQTQNTEKTEIRETIGVDFQESLRTSGQESLASYNNSDPSNFQGKYRLANERMIKLREDDRTID